MDGIIKIVESREKSGLLIDGATETLKYEIKIQEDGFLGTMMVPMAVSLIAPMVSSLIQPVSSSLIKTIIGKESREQKKDKKLDPFHY